MNFVVNKLNSSDFNSYVTTPMQESNVIKEEVVTLQSKNVDIKENIGKQDINEIVNLKLNKTKEINQENKGDNLDEEEIIKQAKAVSQGKKEITRETKKVNKLFGNNINSCGKQYNEEKTTEGNGKLNNIIWYGSLITLVGTFLMLK